MHRVVVENLDRYDRNHGLLPKSLIADASLWLGRNLGSAADYRGYQSAMENHNAVLRESNSIHPDNQHPGHYLSQTGRRWAQTPCRRRCACRGPKSIPVQPELPRHSAKPVRWRWWECAESWR